MKKRVRDTDAVCIACRHKGGHNPTCARATEPWPEIEVDYTADFEAVLYEAQARLQAIAGQPVFVHAAVAATIDEDGDPSADCWGPITEAEEWQAANAAFVFRERATDLFTQATGLPWSEDAHTIALRMTREAHGAQVSDKEARD